MTTPKYVKSFSQGQITIPKDFREQLQLENVFWLKLSLEADKIIAEPVVESTTSSNYSQKLLKIRGNWFSLPEWKQIRHEINSRHFSNHWLPPSRQ